MNTSDPKIVYLAMILTMLITITPWRELITSPINSQYYEINTESGIVVEKNCINEQLEYSIIHAKILVPMDYDAKKLTDYSRRILDYSLKSKAEKQGISTVWITFYFTDNPQAIPDSTKNYRVIYFRYGSNWMQSVRATRNGT
ncbi:MULTISPECIES: hypothetical protein [Methylorubrum]|uniref:hypothetical protein n=1 Tax=Methylorubrum TaxID=2282523 RepID=UPI0020A0638F|nr:MULTISPECIES: hypothetical protein [Methylorubrum]MCP1550090.1 hypothetical protein [Methylorubrum zatmanii]MCP1553296.1 hypothetical protein [Methylorubrum extorquens]MCP1580392.1 hypothetical protein [Methylorubrum extorquens]